MTIILMLNKNYTFMVLDEIAELDFNSLLGFVNADTFLGFINIDICIKFRNQNLSRRNFELILVRAGEG